MEASDDVIGTNIKLELDDAKWAPKSGVKINVHQKIVDLEGVVFSEEERRAVNIIAENTPGVHAVRDHLVFVDPGSGIAFPEI